MTDSDAPTPNSDELEQAAKAGDKKRKRRVEFLGALIIAIAAVLTAFATYQSGEADGIVEEKNTKGIGLTLQSNDAFNVADAVRAEERDWFFSWITQVVNEQAAADVLEAAMPDDVYLLAGEWLEANIEFFESPDILAIEEPFSETYASFTNLHSEQLIRDGNDIYRRAQCAFFEAREADVRGDRIGLATIYLAISLVVAGIAALMNGKAAQIIVITTATLSLVGGAAELGVAGDLDEARATAAVDFFVNEDGSDIVVDIEDDPESIGTALEIVHEACPELAPNPGADSG